ncbi:tyrosine-type recombinase/integrase [Burkholderia cepacia]|uniref:tyrosine-type recombinase/integrase n=1 Tax=Burkholderia cepacia TaxID=292 RepID=UPI001CF2A30B|nr:tyrosine-type recombinase/integrase [Burkholderia cepacia]MCA8323784.1 tyrosine-type recombinase/integrase [Burkholderia cepacia]
MHLVKSTNEYKIAGVPRPSFPILLWEDMTSCWEANEFLRYYLTRGAIGSENSWEPTGRALYDFFSFLEVHDLDWKDVSRSDKTSLIDGYRMYCFDVVGLARNTVRQRVRYICAFYEFALKEGWIKALPFKYEIRQYGGGTKFLAHTAATGGLRQVRSVMPRKHKDLPTFLSKAEAKLVLEAAINRHHRAIIRFALESGLRREELASFPLAYVVDPDKTPSQTRNIRIKLDPSDGTGMKTKGSRARTIIVGRSTMRDLFHYAKRWRGERASTTNASNPQLFLNQDGNPWAADGKGIEAMVRRVGATVGIKAHPHMLRHTYATHTLVELQRNRGENRVEPLVFLKNQLGHASISTTMVYLHLINELADEATLAYSDEVDALVEEI